MHTPGLAHLMGAYFHQDWYDEHQDEWENVDDFLRSEPLAGRLPSEITEVLEHFDSDEALGEYLWSLGSYYVANPRRGGHRRWLEEISARAVKASGGS